MKIIAALCCVLASLQVAAEPSGLVKKLMETEATMFDLGLLRLQRRLEDDVILKRHQVSYSSLTNQIEIVRNIMSLGDEGEKADKFCVDGKELDCFAYLKKILIQENGWAVPSV